MNPVIHRFTLSAAFVLATAAVASAQSYSIDWHSIDGGGGINCTDGQPNGFELRGTIGQPDAQVRSVMSGGGFELSGGFAPVTQICYCLGDMTGDSLRDGRDVQKFVNCLIADRNCSCADIDAVNGVTFDDISGFVTNLLATAPCP